MIMDYEWSLGYLESATITIDGACNLDDSVSKGI